MKQCPFCAEQIQETAKKCRHCGEWLDGRPPEAEEAERHEPPSGDPALRLVMPTGDVSVLAVFAGYAGLFSALCFPGPIALILGILAVRDIKANKKYGMGRAVFGIVMGLLGTIMLVLMAIGMVRSP